VGPHGARFNGAQRSGWQNATKKLEYRARKGTTENALFLILRGGRVDVSPKGKGIETKMEALLGLLEGGEGSEPGREKTSRPTLARRQGCSEKGHWKNHRRRRMGWERVKDYLRGRDERQGKFLLSWEGGRKSILDEGIGRAPRGSSPKTRKEEETTSAKNQTEKKYCGVSAGKQEGFNIFTIEKTLLHSREGVGQIKGGNYGG